MFSEETRRTLEKIFVEYLDRLYWDIPEFDIPLKIEIFDQLEKEGHDMSDEAYYGMSDQEFVEKRWQIMARMARQQNSGYVDVLKVLWDYLPEEAELSVDVGCGNMQILGFLHKANALPGKLIGVEPCDAIDERAKDLWIIRAWPSRIPLRDCCADFVFCSAVFHLCKGWRDVLADMVRIAKPGATIFIVFVDHHRAGAYYWNVKSEMERLGVTPIMTSGPTGLVPGLHFVVGEK